MSFVVIIPTLNAGATWSVWIKAFKIQSHMPEVVFVIDSGSSDETVIWSKEAGFNVCVIRPSEFDHGSTRQHAVDNIGDVQFVVFLTQDAILATPDAIENILLPLADDRIAAVCGRQLPRKNAKPIEVHARIFNYSDQSFTRAMDDVKTHGLKTAFISNSFAAYRISALKEIGGFPDNVIFGEDMYVAAKILKAGYKIAYAADAGVYHSHDYTLLQEFRRYFDMGVFHGREQWIQEEFGGAEGEGLKFVRSELMYLLRHAFWLIPEALVRKVFGYIGFRMGLIEKELPLWLKIRLSMNKGFFVNNRY